MVSLGHGWEATKPDQKNGKKLEEKKSKEQKTKVGLASPFLLCFLASFTLAEPALVSLFRKTYFWTSCQLLIWYNSEKNAGIQLDVMGQSVEREGPSDAASVLAHSGASVSSTLAVLKITEEDTETGEKKNFTIFTSDSLLFILKICPILPPNLFLKSDAFTSKRLGEGKGERVEIKFTTITNHCKGWVKERIKHGLL